jgi:hypothetical protein
MIRYSNPFEKEENEESIKFNIESFSGFDLNNKILEGNKFLIK